MFKGQGVADQRPIEVGPVDIREDAPAHCVFRGDAERRRGQRAGKGDHTLGVHDGDEHLGLEQWNPHRPDGAIFLKLGPFDPELVDRRVSACLSYLRAQADPFGQFRRPDANADDVPFN